MNCTMHSLIYLFCTAIRNEEDSQTDVEGLENGQVVCAISKGDEVDEVTRSRRYQRGTMKIEI